jgi:cystathionine beta-lyase/cystathionine gamma-synthase
MAGMDPERRRSAGISDGLIRMSVELESPDENVDDVLQALDTARSAAHRDTAHRGP